MSGSKTAVYSALFANLAIAVVKFVAAAVTGSAAMVSEGIHSVVDTGNEVLLLLGIRRSKRPPDASRPFGYGRELYFWAFIVSILIFAVGAGVSFYEGIVHLRHPAIVINPFWNYLVLGFAFIFDGISFTIALRQFNRERGATPFWQAVKHSKDPTTFVVLFEDAADVTGITVAFIAIWLGHTYHNPYFDGIGSLVIGAILSIVSVVLARQSYSLLMGETASPAVLHRVIEVTTGDPGIVRVVDQLSTFLGPEEIVLVLYAVFPQGQTTENIIETIDRLKQKIKQRYPYFKRILIQPVKESTSGVG